MISTNTRYENSTFDYLFFHIEEAGVLFSPAFYVTPLKFSKGLNSSNCLIIQWGKMVNDESTTLTVSRKDKKKFKDLVNKYGTYQYKLFGVMIKVIKEYDPEVKSLLK
jgi:hypothetical protein|tara:strand:+ start:1206 stop:1529 length:324 start_codon:yes stop_codon:yes gene_type:complete